MQSVHSSIQHFGFICIFVKDNISQNIYVDLIYVNLINIKNLCRDVIMITSRHKFLMLIKST